VERGYALSGHYSHYLPVRSLFHAEEAVELFPNIVKEIVPMFDMETGKYPDGTVADGWPHLCWDGELGVSGTFIRLKRGGSEYSRLSGNGSTSWNHTKSIPRSKWPEEIVELVEAALKKYNPNYRGYGQ
jgi:hypothetical protein